MLTSVSIVKVVYYALHFFRDMHAILMEFSVFKL